MAHMHQTSRNREQPVGDEEVTTDLKLGEMTGVPALTHSEALILVGRILGSRKKAGTHQQLEESEVFKKTMDYLQNFARFDTEETTTAVEGLLRNYTVFEQFERAQLGNLVCDSPDEAKTLIPSLTSKINDDDLQRLLEDMNRMRGLGRDG